MTFPALFAAIAVGVLVWDHFSPQHEISVWLAVATLAAVILRMAISFRENRALLAALDDDASTDSLTELGNRRKLMIDLEAAIRATPEVPDHHVFAIYDLDGFKRYNDTYGHPAGDSLLRRLGASLAAAFEADGSAYRLGGDEFCILVPSRGRQTRADRRGGKGRPHRAGGGLSGQRIGGGRRPGGRRTRRKRSPATRRPPPVRGQEHPERPRRSPKPRVAAGAPARA